MAVGSKPRALVTHGAHIKGEARARSPMRSCDRSIEEMAPSRSNERADGPAGFNLSSRLRKCVDTRRARRDCLTGRQEFRLVIADDRQTMPNSHLTVDLGMYDLHRRKLLRQKFRNLQIATQSHRLSRLANPDQLEQSGLHICNQKRVWFESFAEQNRIIGPISIKHLQNGVRYRFTNNMRHRYSLKLAFPPQQLQCALKTMRVMIEKPASFSAVGQGGERHHHDTRRLQHSS